MMDASRCESGSDRTPAGQTRRPGNEADKATRRPGDETLTFFTPDSTPRTLLHPLLQRGGAASFDPLSLTGLFWHAKCARRPRDWPKGEPSPLIGPGGMAAATADRPSNRESNIVLRGLRSLADRRQPRSHPPDWARETPGPLELRPPRALWRQDGAKVLL